MVNAEIITNESPGNELIAFEASPLLPPESVETGIKVVFALEQSPVFSKENINQLREDLWNIPELHQALSQYLQSHENFHPGKRFRYKPHLQIPITQAMTGEARDIVDRHNNVRKTSEELATWILLDNSLKAIPAAFKELEQRTLRYLHYTPQLRDFSMVTTEWEATIPVEERLKIFFGLFERQWSKPFEASGRSVQQSEHTHQLMQAGHLPDQIYIGLVGQIEQSATTLANAFHTASDSFSNLARRRPVLTENLQTVQYPDHLPIQVQIATSSLKCIHDDPTNAGLYIVSFLDTMREIRKLVERKIYRYESREELGILMNTRKILSTPHEYLPHFAKNWGLLHGYTPVEGKNEYGSKEIQGIRRILTDNELTSYNTSSS